MSDSHARTSDATEPVGGEVGRRRFGRLGVVFIIRHIVGFMINREAR
jgi:hypothetical protein